jgi:uncharacterized protein (TIGR02246 family)
MTSDEQSIRRHMALWQSANAAGDVDPVLGLMADDIVFLVPGQPPMKGRSSFERGLRALLTQHRIESTGEVQEVEVSGNLAYCWINLNVRIVHFQAATQRSAREAHYPFLVNRQMAPGSWRMDANLLSPAS